MRERAYAKVNIGLHVGRKRPDGYHDIDTYMALIDLYDDVSAEIRCADSFSCHIVKEREYIVDGKDLMEVAAAAFSAVTGILFSIDISITKRIPAGAGLGGGSSDAAAVLRMLTMHFGTSRENLMKAAAMTGSDVIFFASGYSAAHVAGRGEILSPVRIPEGLKVCVCIPESRVRTADAYSRLDSIERVERELPPLVFSPVPDEKIYSNDFELVSSVSRPFLDSEGPCYVSLTGSGSGWIAIFPSSSSFEIEKTENYGIFMASFIISG